MSRENPAGIHFFTFWQDRSGDTDLPLWLRLASLAYASHRKNGHATFYLQGASTLPEVLGKSKKQVHNEVARAVARGFLAPESNINCLVLPHEICGGADGHERAECKLHPTH